jgi:signal transduction histidine kinase
MISGPNGPVHSGGTIGTRIVLALVGVSVTTLIVVGLIFFGFISRYVVQRERQQLVEQAAAVAAQVERIWGELPMRTQAGPKSLQQFLRINLQILPAGAGITVFKDSEILAFAGPARAGNEQAARYRGEGSKLTADGKPAAATLPAAGSEPRLILAAAQITYGSDDSEGLAVLTLPTSDAIAPRAGLLRILFLSGGIAVILTLLLGLALGGWLNRPLKRLSGAAERMAGGDYRESISGAYPGEIYELAGSLETMRLEVQRSEASLRGFVASAAHELRTPLTSIQGFSQALLDGTAATPEQQRNSAAAIHRESTRLRRLVDSLLTLSRYDSREFRPNLAHVDARALLTEEVQRLVDAGLAPEGCVTLQAGPGVSLVTDPDMLRQVVANLLRNAVEYGGDEPVVVHADSSASQVTLTFVNRGVPLSEGDRAHLFERFYRGRGAHRSEGFGLGLPLVREICEVLGGRVALVGSGPETVFRVTLPRSAVTPAAPLGS